MCRERNLFLMLELKVSAYAYQFRFVYIFILENDSCNCDGRSHILKKEIYCFSEHFLKGRKFIDF